MFKEQYKEGLKLLKHSKPYKTVGRILFAIMITIIGFVDFAIFSSYNIYAAETHTSSDNTSSLSSWYSLEEVDSCQYIFQDSQNIPGGGGRCYLPNDLNLITNTDKFEYVSDKNVTYKEVSFYRWSDNLEVQETTQFLNSYLSDDKNDLSDKTVIYVNGAGKQYTYSYTPTGNEYHYYTLVEMDPTWKDYQLAVDYYTTGDAGQTKYYKTIDDAIFETVDGEIAYYDANFKTILGSDTYDQLKLATNFKVSYDLTGNILYDDTTDGYYKIADSQTISDVNTYHQTTPVSSYRKTDANGLTYEEEDFSPKSYFDTANNKFYLYNSDRHEFAVYVITDSNVNYDEYVTDMDEGLLDGYVFFDNAGTVNFYKTYVMGISSKVLNASANTTIYSDAQSGLTDAEFDKLSNSSTSTSTTIFDLTDEMVGYVNSYEYVWDYIIANKEKWSATYAKVMYNYENQKQSATTTQNYELVSTTDTTNAINLTDDFSSLYNDPKLGQVYYNIDNYKIVGSPAYYTWAGASTLYSTQSANSSTISTSATSTITAYLVDGNYYDNRSSGQTSTTYISPSVSSSSVQTGTTISNYTYDRYYITKSTETKSSTTNPSSSYSSSVPTAAKLNKNSGSYTWYSNSSSSNSTSYTLTEGSTMGYFSRWEPIASSWYDYGDGDTGYTYEYVPIYNIYVQLHEYATDWGNDYSSYSYLTVEVADMTQTVYYDDYECNYGSSNFMPSASVLSFSSAYNRSNTNYWWYDVAYNDFGQTASHTNNGTRTFKQWIDYMLACHEWPSEDIAYNYTITNKHYDYVTTTTYTYYLNTINWSYSSYTGSAQSTISNSTNISGYNGSYVYKNQTTNYTPVYESRKTLTFSSSAAKSIFESYFKNVKGITVTNAYKSSTTTTATVTADYWTNSLGSVSSSNKITIYYLSASYGLGSPFYSNSSYRYYASSFTYYCYYDKYVLNSSGSCSDIFDNYDDAYDYALDNGYNLNGIQANSISYYKLQPSSSETTKTWSKVSSYEESLEAAKSTGAFNTAQSGSDNVTVSNQDGWNSTITVTRNYTRDLVTFLGAENDMSNTYTSTVVIDPSDDETAALPQTKGTSGKSDYYVRVSGPSLVEYIADEVETLTTRASYRQSLTDTDDHEADNLPDGLDYCSDASDTNCVNLASKTKTAATSIYKYTKTVTSYSWTINDLGVVNPGEKHSYTTTNDYKKFYTQTLNNITIDNDGNVNYDLTDEVYSKTVSSMTSVNLIDPQSLYSLSPNGLVRLLDADGNAYYTGAGNVNIPVATTKGKTYTLSFTTNNIDALTVNVENNPCTLLNNGSGRYYYTFTATDNATNINFVFTNANNTTLNFVALREGTSATYADYVAVVEKAHSNTYYKRNNAEVSYETALVNLYYGSNFTTTGDVLTYFDTTNASLTSKAKSETTLTIKGVNGTIAANTTYYYSYKLNGRTVAGSLLSNDYAVFTLSILMSKDAIVSDVRITRTETDLDNCDILSDKIVFKNNGVSIDRSDFEPDMTNIIFEVEIFLEKERNASIDLTTSTVYQKTSSYYTMENLTSKNTITKDELTSYVKYYGYYYPLNSLEGQFALLTQEGELDNPYNPFFVYKYGDANLGIRENSNDYRKVSFYQFDGYDEIEIDPTDDAFINTWDNSTALDGLNGMSKVAAVTKDLVSDKINAASNWYKAIKGYSSNIYSSHELDTELSDNSYYLMLNPVNNELVDQTDSFVHGGKKYTLSLSSSDESKLVEYTIAYKTGSYIATPTISNDFSTNVLTSYGKGLDFEQLDYTDFVWDVANVDMSLYGEFKDWVMLQAYVDEDGNKCTYSAPRYTITTGNIEVDVIDYSQTTVTENAGGFYLPTGTPRSFETAYYYVAQSKYYNADDNGEESRMWVDFYSSPLTKTMTGEYTFNLDVSDNFKSTSATCFSEWIREMLAHNNLSTYNFPNKGYKTEFYKWYCFEEYYDQGGEYDSSSWTYYYHPVYKVCADQATSKVIYIVDFSQWYSVTDEYSYPGEPSKYKALSFGNAYSRASEYLNVWKEYDVSTGKLVESDLMTNDRLSFASWVRKIMTYYGYSLDNYPEIDQNVGNVFRINGGVPVDIYCYAGKYYIKDEITSYDFSSKENGNLTVLYKEDGTTLGFNKLYEKKGTNNAIVYDYNKVIKTADMNGQNIERADKIVELKYEASNTDLPYANYKMLNMTMNGTTLKTFNIAGPSGDFKNFLGDDQHNNDSYIECIITYMDTLGNTEEQKLIFEQTTDLLKEYDILSNWQDKNKVAFHVEVHYKYKDQPEYDHIDIEGDAYNPYLNWGNYRELAIAVKEMSDKEGFYFLTFNGWNDIDSTDGVTQSANDTNTSKHYATEPFYTIKGLSDFEPLTSSNSNIYVLNFALMPNLGVNGEGNPINKTLQSPDKQVPIFLLHTKYNGTSNMSLKNAYDLYGINSWSKTYSSDYLSNTGLTNTGEFLSIDEMLGWYYTKYGSANQIKEMQDELYKILMICEDYIKKFSFQSKTFSDIHPYSILYYTDPAYADDSVYLQFKSNELYSKFVTKYNLSDGDNYLGQKSEYDTGILSVDELKELEIYPERYGFDESPYVLYTKEEAKTYKFFDKGDTISIKHDLFPYLCMNFGASADTDFGSYTGMYVCSGYKDYQRRDVSIGSLFSIPTDDKNATYKDGFSYKGLEGSEAFNAYLNEYIMTSYDNAGTSRLQNLGEVAGSGYKRYNPTAHTGFGFDIDISDGYVFGGGAGIICTVYPTVGSSREVDNRSFYRYFQSRMLKEFEPEGWEDLLDDCYSSMIDWFGRFKVSKNEVLQAIEKYYLGEISLGRLLYTILYPSDILFELELGGNATKFFIPAESKLYTGSEGLYKLFEENYANFDIEMEYFSEYNMSTSIYMPNIYDYFSYSSFESILNKYNLSLNNLIVNEDNFYNNTYYSFYKDANGKDRYICPKTFVDDIIYGSNNLEISLISVLGSAFDYDNNNSKMLTVLNTVDFNAFYVTALSSYASLFNHGENDYYSSIMGDIGNHLTNIDGNFDEIDSLITTYFGEETVINYLDYLFPSIEVTPYKLEGMSFGYCNNRDEWDFLGAMFGGELYSIYSTKISVDSNIPLKYFYTTSNVTALLDQNQEQLEKLKKKSPYFSNVNNTTTFSMPWLLTGVAPNLDDKDKSIKFSNPNDLLVLEKKMTSSSGSYYDNYVYVKMTDEAYKKILNEQGISYYELFEATPTYNGTPNDYNDANVAMTIADSGIDGIVYDNDYTFGSNYETAFDVTVRVPYANNSFINDINYINYALAYEKDDNDVCAAGYTNVAGTNTCYYNNESLSLAYDKADDDKLWYTSFEYGSVGYLSYTSKLFNEEKIVLPSKYKTKLYIDVIMKNNQKLSYYDENGNLGYTISTSDNLVPNPYYAFDDNNVNLDSVANSEILGIGTDVLSDTIKVVPKTVFDAVFAKNLTTAQKTAILSKSVAKEDYTFTDSLGNEYTIPYEFLPKIEYGRDIDVKFKITLYDASGNSIKDASINKIDLVKDGKTVSSAVWNKDGYWFSAKACGVYDVLKNSDFNAAVLRDYLANNYLFKLSSNNGLNATDTYHIGIQLFYSNAKVYIDNNQNDILDSGAHSNYYYGADQALTTVDIDLSDVYDVTNINSEYYSFAKDYAHFVSNANYRKVVLATSGEFLMLATDDDDAYIAG